MTEDAQEEILFERVETEELPWHRKLGKRLLDGKHEQPDELYRVGVLDKYGLSGHVVKYVGRFGSDLVAGPSELAIKRGHATEETHLTSYDSLTDAVEETIDDLIDNTFEGRAPYEVPDTGDILEGVV